MFQNIHSMKSILTFIFLVIFAIGATGQSPLNYSKVKINLQNTDLRQIGALGLETDHGIYARGKHFINDFSSQEIAKLTANGVDFEILIADVKSWYRERNLHEGHDHSHQKNGVDCDNLTTSIDYQTPANYEYGSMGGYLTYSELLPTLDSMAAKYPNLITARQPIDTFLTHEGRPVYWLKVSDNPNVEENEPELLYTALHHSREPNSLSQMIFYLWYLLENYDSDTEIQYLVDNTEMYFIPCINPDGYIYNELTDPQGGGLWRKNRYAQGGTTYGVDLNRNYGFEWGLDDFGSSPDPNTQTFRGPSEFSEPETQAVKHFCNTHQFKITLNYHTYGNLLIYPWGYDSSPTPEHTTFVNFAEVLTKENDYFPGLGDETIGYAVNGVSDDWMFGESTSKPPIFSMTPEVGDQDLGFWPPQSQIDRLNKSALRQNLVAAHLLLNYGEMKETNAATIVDATNGQIELNIKKYGLEAGDLTLSVTPLSNNVTVSTTAQTWSLAHLDDVDTTIDYSINTGTGTGALLEFLLELDNGTYIATDTIRRTYLNTAIIPVFEEDGAAINNWTVAGDWDITTGKFFSSPSSITDSPNGDYQGSATSSITLQNPIDLTDAVTANLKFQTTWAIEDDYDYAQVMASIDGANFTPLCGLYTTPGANAYSLQPPGEPLYDGIQNDWVQESIDLADYLGNQVWIRFTLNSDSFYELDGFYFDDLIVEKTTGMMTGLIDVDAGFASDLVVQPNPVDDKLDIQFTLDRNTESLRLVLVNMLGQVILEETNQHLTSGLHKLSMQTGALPNGVYHLRMTSKYQGTITRKIVKGS